MQCRHAVHGVGADNGQVSHADRAVPENGGLAHGIVIGHAVLFHGLAVAAVDLLDDHIHTRQQIFKQIDRPFLHGFRQHRVIGKGEGL